MSLFNFTAYVSVISYIAQASTNVITSLTSYKFMLKVGCGLFELTGIVW